AGGVGPLLAQPQVAHSSAHRRRTGGIGMVRIYLLGAWLLGSSQDGPLPPPAPVKQTPAAVAPVDLPTDALSPALKNVLIGALPQPLYEKSDNWGHQAMVPTGIRWTGHGLRRHAEIVRSPKNHGTWRKTKVTADNVDKDLVFELRGLQAAGEGK